MRAIPQAWWWHPMTSHFPLSLQRWEFCESQAQKRLDIPAVLSEPENPWLSECTMIQECVHKISYNKHIEQLVRIVLGVVTSVQVLNMRRPQGNPVHTYLHWWHKQGFTRVCHRGEALTHFLFGRYPTKTIKYIYVLGRLFKTIPGLDLMFLLLWMVCACWE